MLAERLAEIGINTHQDLAALGSVEAALKLDEIGLYNGINMLYALEGAVQKIRWHAIPIEELRLVKEEFDKAREGN